MLADNLASITLASPDDLPLEAIGKLISAISSEKWLEMYEQSRLMTKAGQAQKAKQKTPIGEPGGRQARRHKASAVSKTGFPTRLRVACL